MQGHARVCEENKKELLYNQVLNKTRNDLKNLQF